MDKRAAARPKCNSLRHRHCSEGVGPKRNLRVGAACLNPGANPVANGIAAGLLGARLRRRLASPEGGTAVSLADWPRGLAAALILRAGTEQNSKPGSRAMEQNPLIPATDPELLGCFGRRKALNVTQGYNLGIPGRKRSDRGEDGARRLISND